VADPTTSPDRTDRSLAGEPRSLWLETTRATDYDALDGDLAVDTVVAGAGIAGITTAAELAAAGQSVALVERDRVATGVTGHTSAKLTSLHGAVYGHVAEQFGTGAARRYAAANEAAVDHVEATVADLDRDCGFARTPAYTYTESRGEVATMRDEAAAARAAGLDATFVEEPGLPYEVEGAVAVGEQARFHPRAYLLGLVERFVADGGHVFEETTVTDVADGEPCRVETDRGRLTADDVVVATHFPVYDHALYFARLVPQRSYVLDVTLDGSAPEGLFYDPDEPYFSLRPRPEGDDERVLVGGVGHRTGEGGDTTERYRRLERMARDRLDVASVERRWSTQDFTSQDRVPFVGPHSPRSDHVFVATGFGGWGMTGGTAAGRLLADLVRGVDNEYADLYRPTRLDPGASLGRLAEHGVTTARHYVEDYVTDRPPASVPDLAPGEGRVVQTDAGPVAVHRDETGAYEAVSAVCSHMGALVEWNEAEASWDCPCHGSRFDTDGSVLATPATEGLDDRDYPSSADPR
jgi:glycine/D-amino acid oxidase-like deaminating enzyme/nitrite reductase/ring-hydroxylating ferredoxin subunit